MKRAFISFDFDNDRVLKDFFVGQFKLPGSPFTASDWSMKEAAPQSNWEQEAAPQSNWEQEAERRIRRSDIVIVLVGSETHRASGVLKEVAIARRLGKPMVQIIGYKDSRPTRVSNAGRLIRWSWDNLKKILRDGL